MKILYRLSHFSRLINVTIYLTFSLICSELFAKTAVEIINSNITIHNNEIAVTIYPSSSNDLILWLPSEHGIPDSVHEIATSLSDNQAQQQAEVWVMDLLGSLFLPEQPSSINQVPDALLESLIADVYSKTQKRIFIVASGKGALLAMRSSYYWLQHSQRAQEMGGIVLLYPNLFTKTPEPGTSADYYPIVSQVNLPIYILQPEKSPWRWQLKHLYQFLVYAKATPYITILPNIRDRFHFRPDATRHEQQATKTLAVQIKKALAYIKSEKIERYSAAKKIPSRAKKTYAKKESKLTLYQHDPIPPRLKLMRLNNQISELREEREKVVIVNFWASWCPPCVYEMPSMEKLYRRYPKSKFTILAVNMAEDTATITQFLQNQVNVSFPILLDQQGTALQDWQVYAFPSSFVIGKKGKIRYALFGSILWDTPEVTDIIDKLLNE